MVEAIEATGIAWYWWASGLWVVGAFVTLVICGYLDIDDGSAFGFTVFWPAVGAFFAVLILCLLLAVGPWSIGAWIRRKTERRA